MIVHWEENSHLEGEVLRDLTVVILRIAWRLAIGYAVYPTNGVAILASAWAR